VSRRKLIGILIVLLVITSFLWVPLVVFAVTDNLDKFDYYVKALEYGLKGLVKYFDFILKLFEKAVTSS